MSKESSAPVTIDLSTIRRNADRQREDAETIAQLCDGLNSLIAENKSLSDKLAAAEKKLVEAEKKLEPGKKT